MCIIALSLIITSWFFELCLFYQEAITEYKGTVVTVSHDRYFIKQIVNRVIEVKDGNLQDYAGDYNVSVTSLQFKLLATFYHPFIIFVFKKIRMLGFS